MRCASLPALADGPNATGHDARLDQHRRSGPTKISARFVSHRAGCMIGMMVTWKAARAYRAVTRAFNQHAAPLSQNALATGSLRPRQRLRWLRIQVARVCMFPEGNATDRLRSRRYTQRRDSDREAIGRSRALDQSSSVLLLLSEETAFVAAFSFLILPKPLEPSGRQLSVAHRVLDTFVP